MRFVALSYVPLGTYICSSSSHSHLRESRSAVYLFKPYISQLCFSDSVHRDPVEAVHKMESKVDGPEGKEVASATGEQKKGIEGLTWAELSTKWADVVEALKGGGVNVINPGHALEGGLSIRYTTRNMLR